jgi:ribosomal protein S12 methylthiotransferase
MTRRRDNPRVCLVSLGCPKNLVDSERMLAILAEGGCLVGAPMEASDVVVINTCAFIDAAMREAWDVIGQAIDLKKSGSVRRVVVAGCLPSRHGRSVQADEGEIDAVLSVANRDEILSAVIGKGSFARLDDCGLTPPDDRGRFRLTPPHTAYLRISEGCSRGCTYCTIPSIRGRLRSKPPRLVLAEAEELAAAGAVELNVIAQDTTAYGEDFPPPLRSRGGRELAGLLARLDEIDGVEWIRLLYTYPRSFGDELVEALVACRHVVPYVDIPLQHISDGVLRRMGRGVGRGEVECLLRRLRPAVPRIAVRTTFIVGFPGETEREFDELLEFVETTRFDALGVFEFSPEEGTPAAEMPEQVAPALKAERAERIMLAQQAIAFEANARMIGRTIDVLVDGGDGHGGAIARHAGQAPDIDSVCLLSAPAEAGTFVRASVTASDGYDLVVAPAAGR